MSFSVSFLDFVLKCKYLALFYTTFVQKLFFINKFKKSIHEKIMDSFIKQSPKNQFLEKYIDSFFEIKFSNKGSDYLPAFPNASMTLGFFIKGGFDILNIGPVGIKEKILFSKIASHTTWVKPIGEEIELVGVHFKPNAISLFTDTSLCCLPKQINPEIIFEGNLKQLSTDIIKTKDVKNRFQIIETFLLASIKNKPNIRLDSVYNKIIQQQGNAKISSISKQLNITSRTIRNDFKEKIGCSPKHLSRIIRFHSTLNKIISNIPQNQSLDLAFENGYFDQSHFINDFKYFSGLTPKQLFIKNPNFRFFQF